MEYMSWKGGEKNVQNTGVVNGERQSMGDQYAAYTGFVLVV